MNGGDADLRWFAPGHIATISYYGNGRTKFLKKKLNDDEPVLKQVS